MDEVHLVDYGPLWSEMSDAEIERISNALPPCLVLAVEHFGSTSIPGMVAKSVIDRLIVVRLIEEGRKTAVKPMKALGYAFWGDNPHRDRLFSFWACRLWRRIEDITCTSRNETGICGTVCYFATTSETTQTRLSDTPALKRRLASQHKEGREAYTAAKSRVCRCSHGQVQVKSTAI